MPTIWTFGDSLTEGYSEKYDWSKSYIEWKKYKPKVYCEFLSEKLNFDLQNLGKGGSDNYTIFQTFCNISHKIKDNDLIIFGWSSPVRFRLSTPNDNWNTYIPNFDKNYPNIKTISVDTIKETLINRESFLFCDEVNSWIKLINNFLKNMKVVHWTYFDHRLKAFYVRNLETISKETNKEVDDPHFSENGHFELSEILFNLYKQKNQNKLI